jgi:drug/metabolite transporter (DMT)-like permease
MVRDPPRQRADVSNRGITRGRFFIGTLLLLAAMITWGTALLMSPHGEPSSTGVEHVRTTIVVFLRNSAIGTLVLSALSGWLLFPRRRPKNPIRDWAIAGMLGVLVLSSVYQLVWIEASVLR